MYRCPIVIWIALKHDLKIGHQDNSPQNGRHAPLKRHIWERSSQIAKTLGSASIRHRSDPFASDRCQPDVDHVVSAIRDIQAEVPSTEDYRTILADDASEASLEVYFHHHCVEAIVNNNIPGKLLCMITYSCPNRRLHILLIAQCYWFPHNSTIRWINGSICLALSCQQAISLKGTPCIYIYIYMYGCVYLSIHLYTNTFIYLHILGLFEDDEGAILIRRWWSQWICPIICNNILTFGSGQNDKFHPKVCCSTATQHLFMCWLGPDRSFTKSVMTKICDAIWCNMSKQGHNESLLGRRNLINCNATTSVNVIVQFMLTYYMYFSLASA